MEEKERIIAIDGTSLAYRAFYALPRLETSSGRPTGATLGFFNMILRLLEDYKPLTVFVTFDHPKKTFRHALEERYKVSRKPMPDMLRPQLEDMKEILAYFGFPVLEVPGFEGDDLIGSLKKCLRNQYLLLIVTSDLDLLQLLDEHTVLLQPVQGVTRLRLIRSEDLEEELGISPPQVVDFLALSGDVSDDIQGVQGIGEKRAAQLLKQFGSWEGILTHIDELSPALRENLLCSRERVETNRTLVTIRQDVPLECRVEAWNPEKVNWSSLFQKLEELELRKLRERLEKKRHSKYFLVLRRKDFFITDGKNLERIQGIPTDKEWMYFLAALSPDPLSFKRMLETPGIWCAPLLLFVVYPFLFSWREALALLQGSEPFLPHEELFSWAEKARLWLIDHPSLQLAYRDIEILLLRDILLKKLFCDSSLSDGQATLFSDLPLLVSPISFSMGGAAFGEDPVHTTQNQGGLVASQTLYGWRFVGTERDSQEKFLESYRGVFREEVFHLVMRILSERGVQRFRVQGEKLFVEKISQMESLEGLLCEISGRLSEGRWLVTLHERGTGEYELFVVGREERGVWK